MPVILDYSFKLDGSADKWWIAGETHIVSYTATSPNNLELKNGDQVQVKVTWTEDYDGSIGFTFINTVNTSLYFYLDGINYPN